MRILIIKLGARGDVLRTLPIVRAIKEKYPLSQITFITKKESAELIEGVSFIDRVDNIHEINEEFDILYNFDMEEEATNLAMKTKAKKKYGFYNEEGFPATFNLSSEYYLNTLFDDELKMKNRKTYQEMMFEAAEIPYQKQPFILNLDKEDINYANEFVKKNNIDTSSIIGLHIGSSHRWPSKSWNIAQAEKFILKAKQKGDDILFFRGPNEAEKYNSLINKLSIYKNHPDNTPREFASLVNLCKAMICSDSFSLHVSLALKKPTIGLFFCTSPYEVEDYGLLTKIISPLLPQYFPEKMDKYSEELTNSINAEQVLNTLEKIK